ncbi:MAG: HAMP domain-containing protein, partial [Nakamurella sp.]
MTILLFAMVMIACAAVGVATSVVIRNFLTSRLDHDLMLAGSRYAISLEHNDNDADNHPETGTVGQPIGTLGARLLNGMITAVGVVSDSRSPVAVSAADRAGIVDLATSGATEATVHFPGMGSYRVLVARGADGDVLVTGLPERPVDEVVEVLAWTELVVFLVVAVIIGLIGGFAVRRSLRPLQRVTATALRVSELPLAAGEVALTERVPGDDEATEVGRVAAAVNHMLTQVETAFTERQRSENRLRQFIADASHELRTPLA